MKDFLFFETLRDDDKVIKDRVMQILVDYDDGIDNAINFIKHSDEYVCGARELCVACSDVSVVSKRLSGFVARTLIIDYLGRKGYLSSSKYGFQAPPHISPVINDLSFYLNISALQRDVEIKRELKEYFEGYDFEEYIEELCNPKEDNMCECCGTYRYIHKLMDDEHKICLDCFNSSSEQFENMKMALQSGDSIRSICLREQYDNGAVVAIADGYSPYKVIREFIDSCKDNEESYETKFCRATFDLLNEPICVVEHPDYGTVAFCMDNFNDYEVFFRSIVLEPDGHTIRLIEQWDDSVLLGNTAVDLACALVGAYQKRLEQACDESFIYS